MSNITPDELLVEAWPPRREGGQHVGVACGVMITHLPSGLVAIANTERSQRRNRAIAMDMLAGGLTSPYFR